MRRHHGIEMMRDANRLDIGKAVGNHAKPKAFCQALQRRQGVCIKLDLLPLGAKVFKSLFSLPATATAFFERGEDGAAPQRHDVVGQRRVCRYQARAQQLERIHIPARGDCRRVDADPLRHRFFRTLDRRRNRPQGVVEVKYHCVDAVTQRIRSDTNGECFAHPTIMR